ncbi:MAG TPA: M48 family metallopeptidase [Tepiditoga sp.]|nr:M48 family metallopeptidase [Thermotogota bacterium]HOO74246.1 M48 family metallopeptidase [Tepiditoga sp.]
MKQLNSFEIYIRGVKKNINIFKKYNKSLFQEKSNSIIIYTVYEDRNNHTEIIKNFLREYSGKYIPKRTEYYKKIIGVNFNKIRIKDQKSRWGSCSSLGNLNFNYKIIQAPDEIIDYVIIHELCHLIEMNHSERFWKNVAKYDPKYITNEKWLKNNTLKLFTINGLAEIK